MLLSVKVTESYALLKYVQGVQSIGVLKAQVVDVYV